MELKYCAITSPTFGLHFGSTSVCDSMVLSKHTITCHGWCYLPVFRHIVTYCTLCTLENWQRQYKSPRYVLKYGTMLYDPWVRYEWEYSGALVRLFPGFMWRIRRVPITRIIIKPHISFVKIWNLLSSSNIVARKGYFWSSLHSGNVTHRSSSNPSSVESVFICLAANTRYLFTSKGIELMI